MHWAGSMGSHPAGFATPPGLEGSDQPDQLSLSWFFHLVAPGARPAACPTWGRRRMASTAETTMASIRRGVMASPLFPPPSRANALVYAGVRRDLPGDERRSDAAVSD